MPRKRTGRIHPATKAFRSKRVHKTTQGTEVLILSTADEIDDFARSIGWFDIEPSEYVSGK